MLRQVGHPYSPAMSFRDAPTESWRRKSALIVIVGDVSPPVLAKRHRTVAGVKGLMVLS